MRATPAAPGFYWAKWRIASPGTEDGGAGCMGADADWEVVEVWENNIDLVNGDHHRVFIPGVARSQSIENFFWGPGPLTPPS